MTGKKRVSSITTFYGSLPFLNQGGVRPGFYRCIRSMSIEITVVELEVFNE
jgi:hypothetical protein